MVFFALPSTLLLLLRLRICYLLQQWIVLIIAHYVQIAQATRFILSLCLDVCIFMCVCVWGCTLCCAGFEFYKYFNNLYRKMELCVPGTGLAWPWHCLWYTWFFYSLPFAFPFPFSFPYSALDICMSFRTRSQLNCSDNPGDKSINICLT